jgi:acyl-CoA synthetase (AMP-forming)/AMP-acid ligase II
MNGVIDPAREAARLQAWRAELARVAAEPLHAHVPALLAEAAAARPERVLLDLFETGRTLRCGELEAFSTHLARALRERGLGPGSRVAVMLPNGIAWPITWFALLKLGAAAVPVNPAYTPRELAYVLGNAEADAWIVDADLAPAAGHVTPWPASLPRERVFACGGVPGDGSAWAALIERGRALPDPVLAPPTLRTLANLQYTSGTTGFPKGCRLSHGYWLNLARGAQMLHVASMRRFFTAQPFFYMDPFWQLLVALRCGGTLVAAQKISGSRFLGWLADHRIEWAQLPELALQSLDAVRGRELTLKMVFTFGWSAASRAAFHARFAPAVALEAFGMTEIGLGAAMPPGSDAGLRPTSVGVATLRRELRIVDAEGLPVAAGQAGELQVCGEHLFDGYFRQPEADREAFDGEWFRTGDAFVADAQGYLRLVGRFKDMIRRSGENIAAREVEAVVRQLPQVADCAAVPVRDERRGEEVKIVVQLQPGAALAPAELLAHCRTQLAAFKLPRYVQWVDDFPRTPSNKIAKSRLTAAAGDATAGCYDRERDEAGGRP